MKPLTLLAAAMLLQSCFLGRENINEPLDVIAARGLRPGSTSAKEVVEILGAPSEYAEDTRADELWAFFDENQVLSHLGSTFSSHRTSYSLPWSDIHDKEDMAEADADRPELGTSK